MWPTQISRRRALGWCLGGSAALAVRIGRAQSTSPSVPSVAEMIESFRRGTTGDAFDCAARAIRAGADLESFLAAVFLAGVHDVQPRHVGGKLHAVMMVASTLELASLSAPREAWLYALWNLDDFKRAQQMDKDQGDWELPPPPAATIADESEARRELVSAMEAWDLERADRALVSLIPSLELGALYEILWPFAARSYVDIGHKIIYASQIQRALARIGARHAEPALRSLVMALLYRPSGERTEAFVRSRELAPKLPASWLAGREDPDQCRRLLSELRPCSSEQAQQCVVAAFTSRIGPGTVWDTLRLWASELFLHRPKSSPASDRAALLPVHAVTVTHALGHAWRTARSDATRRLLVLQASGWLPQLRDDLAEIVGLPKSGPTIDTLGQSAGPSTPLSEVLSEPTPDTVQAALARDPEGAAAYRSRLVSSLAHGASEHHQHKYAAAMLEEAARVDARWSPHLLACAVPYLPTRTGDSELRERSLHVLQAAGIG